MSTRRPKREFYFWDPEFCWEILRRTDSYKRAVDKYVADAKESNDGAGLAFLSSVSHDVHLAPYLGEADTANQRRMRSALHSNIWTIERWINDQIEVNPSNRKYIKQLRETFDTPHVRRFQKKYGDILLFPIFPRTESPHEELMRAVWRLSPVNAPTNQSSKSIVKVSFDLNLSFSNTAILNAVKEAVDLRLETYREDHLLFPNIKSKKRWSEFHLYVRAWDLWCGAGGPKIGYQKIGDTLKIRSIKDAGSRKKWAENAINHIKNVWMPFFDR
jgi:hypothetical protein